MQQEENKKLKFSSSSFYSNLVVCCAETVNLCASQDILSHSVDTFKYKQKNICHVWLKLNRRTLKTYGLFQGHSLKSSR